MVIANSANRASAAAAGAAFQKRVSSIFQLCRRPTVGGDEYTAAWATSFSLPGSFMAKTGSLKGFQIGQSEVSPLFDVSSACSSLFAGFSVSASFGRATDGSTGNDPTGTGYTCTTSASAAAAITGVLITGIGSGNDVSETAFAALCTTPQT